MSNALVPNPDRIRLAMLGMNPGNGHPFSWTAILNGRYDAARMAECGYPVIPEYLGAQPPENLGIPGVEVTHVWCDDPADTQRVAEACFIPHRLDRLEDALGKVDAVVLPTDVGSDHLERARPFIDADIPVFIDKPLTDDAEHLEQFEAWDAAGKAFFSSSAMRYSPPLVALRDQLDSVGEPRLIVVTMCKSWAAYGIHALEAVYPMLRPGGWATVRNAVEGDAQIVHVHHDDGVEVLMPTVRDMTGGFGHVGVYGTTGSLAARSDDTFTAFKTQLQAFVDYLRTGERPVPFEHLAEQMRIVIAALRSGEAGGRAIDVPTLQPVAD
jgi:predicted dehydrogenase